jgi:argininosuccinate lyase
MSRIRSRFQKAADKRGYLLATDLADYLVKKGEVFRTAHDVVARLVSYAMKKGKAFGELSLAEYKDFSPLFDDDVYSITVETSLAARDVTGGTARNRWKRHWLRPKKYVAPDFENT